MRSSTILKNLAKALLPLLLTWAAVSAASTSPLAMRGRPSIPVTLLICIVPNEDARQTQVALRIATAPHLGMEAVTATLVEGGKNIVMALQAASSEVTAALKKGEFASVLLKDDFTLGNGVMMNAGFIAISPGQDQLEGFLAANGSVYPLSCKFP